MKHLMIIVSIIALIGLMLYSCEKDEALLEGPDVFTEETADLRGNDCTKEGSEVKVSTATLQFQVCAQSMEAAEQEAKKTSNLLPAITAKYFGPGAPLHPNCGEFTCNNQEEKCVLGKTKVASGWSIVSIIVNPMPIECPNGLPAWNVMVTIKKLHAKVKCACEK